MARHAKQALVQEDKAPTAGTNPKAPVKEYSASAETSRGRKRFRMPESSHAGRYGLVFVLVILAWIVLDRVSKIQFLGMQPGPTIAGPYLGIIDIRLVHNTGAAWGIFADSTFALGIFSVIVCAVLTIYFIATIRQANALTTLGFGMVVAGGIGNAVDRFTYGYVTDFIEFSFMDFPVFNVADIGVTVGFAFIIIGLLVMWRRSAARDRA